MPLDPAYPQFIQLRQEFVKETAPYGPPAHIREPASAPDQAQTPAGPAI